MAPAKERRTCSKRYGLRSLATRQKSVVRNRHASKSRHRKCVKPVTHHRRQITHAKSSEAPQGSSSLHNMEHESSSHGKILDEDRSIKQDEFHTLNSNDVQCSICLDTVTDDYRMEEINACKHHFHKNCLQNWMRKNKVCPVCRRMVPIYVFSDSESDTENNNESRGEIDEELPRRPLPLSESTLNYAYMQIIDNLDHFRHGRFTTEYLL